MKKIKLKKVRPGFIVNLTEALFEKIREGEEFKALEGLIKRPIELFGEVGEIDLNVNYIVIYLNIWCIPSMRFRVDLPFSSENISSIIDRRRNLTFCV